MSDLPRVDQLRRFTVYGSTPDEPNGESVGVGVEFPSGEVAIDVPLATEPTMWSSMDEFRRRAGDDLARGPGGDVWVEYEDSEA